MHSTKKAALGLGLALCLALSPLSAFAADEASRATSLEADSIAVEAGEDASENSPASADEASGENVSDAMEDLKAETDEEQLQVEKEKREEVQADLKEELEKIEAEKREQAEKEAKQAEEQKKEAEKTAAEATDKVLKYKRSAINQIGTQEQTGHTICCPSFSCAYGDAVIDGTVHDHSYYTCSCCTWNDWGAGASVDRCVGSSEELLREAYDQISAGKPTVIHVAGYGSGEHWICLIGYKNAENPDSLTLDNFVALDPWDGAEITASDRYSLYGDGCEHISSR